MSDALLREKLSRLPSVTEVLEIEGMAALLQRRGRAPVREAIREALDEAREALRAGRVAEAPPAGEIARTAAGQSARRDRPNLRRVLNATGIVLHTGLGRAPLADEAIAAVEEAAGYCNLETDLSSGRRSHRQDNVRELLCELTGAQAATVVNNNAAATMLVLRALAAGREVVVSRGQLIEIGGSFRLPDVMAASGARLREVGTTNRTHLRDYEGALSEDTAAFMRVHTSNYRVVGFTTAPSLADLVALAQRAGVLVIDDIGSGALFEVESLTGAREPVAARSVAGGADVVLFSGDKLLGGPQAGILVGRAECIATLERDPLMRVVRVDKLMLSALEATLKLHRDRDLALARLPLYQMLSQTGDELRRRAQALRRRLSRAAPEATLEVIETVSFVGGGSVPASELPSWAVSAAVSGRSTETLAQALREGEPAVFPRIEGDCLLFDLRTIRPGEEVELARALARQSST